MTEQKSSNAKKWVKYGAAALILVCLLGAVLLTGRRSADEEKSAEEKTVKVAVQKVEYTGNDVALEYTGLVQPSEIIQVPFGTVGTVDKVLVKEGDTVQKGQLLATLNADEADRQQINLSELAKQTDQAAATAQAARDEAKRDYEKACTAADAKALAEAKTARDQAQNQRDSAKAELETKKTEQQSAQTAADAAQAEYDAARAPLDAAADAAVSAAQAEEAEKQQQMQTKEAARDEVRTARDAVYANGDTSEEEKAAADAALANAETELAEAQTAYEQARAATAQAKQQKADVILDPSLQGYARTLTEAQTQLAQKKAETAAAESRLTAQQGELNARSAAYDALAQQGPNSTEAKIQKQRLDAAEAALSSAQSAQLTARNGYETAKDGVEDCDLHAPSDGTVIKVLASEGGMGSPIMPAVVIGSNRASIQFGASQSDVRKLAVGANAVVTVEDKEYAGTITNIGTMPDPTTRTYMVSVDINSDTDAFYLGEMAAVKIEAGERKGAWMPLSCVLNDGEDFVYLAENGRAVRRPVRILDVHDDQLLLEGLEPGSAVIVEGMKMVRSGSAVTTD